MRILITGGTSGIGLGVARHARAAGWEVTIVGRRRSEATRIASELGATFLEADLSLMSGARCLVEMLDAPLDAVVLCAGAISTSPRAELTSEGIERTFATNYLGKFAVSQLLLAQDKLARDGRIVMVGGNGAYKRASTDWATPGAGPKAAFTAALAVDLYAGELARRHPELSVHTCYPGVVRTNLFRDAPVAYRVISRLAGKSADRGSAYLFRLLEEPRVEVHFTLDRPMRFAPPLPSDDVAEQLWEYSERTLLALSS